MRRGLFVLSSLTALRLAYSNFFVNPFSNFFDVSPWISKVFFNVFLIFVKDSCVERRIYATLGAQAAPVHAKSN